MPTRPRPEGAALEVQPGPTTPRPHEHLLRDVLGVLRRAEAAQRDGVHQAAVPVEGGAERGRVARDQRPAMVVFDNGSERKQAAVDFVQWLTAAEQVKADSLATGDLPTRTSVGQDAPFVKQLNKNLPGSSTFVANLSNVKKVRPAVEQYPAISEAMGQAIVSVLLGKAQPADALDQAAQATDAALSGS